MVRAVGFQPKDSSSILDTPTKDKADMSECLGNCLQNSIGWLDSSYPLHSCFIRDIA